MDFTSVLYTIVMYKYICKGRNKYLFFFAFIYFCFSIFSLSPACAIHYLSVPGDAHLLEPFYSTQFSLIDISNLLLESESLFPKELKTYYFQIVNEHKIYAENGVVLGVVDKKNKLTGLLAAVPLKKDEINYKTEKSILRVLHSSVNRIDDEWLIKYFIIDSKRTDKSAISMALLEGMINHERLENCSTINAIIRDKSILETLPADAHLLFKRGTYSYIQLPPVLEKFKKTDMTQETGSRLHTWIEDQNLPVSEEEMLYVLEHGFPIPKCKRNISTSDIHAQERVNIGIIAFDSWVLEDNLEIMRIGQRFKNANTIIVNNKDDILFENKNDFTLVKVKRGFMYLDGELSFVEFSEPLTIHFAFIFILDTFRDKDIKEQIAQSGIPQMGSTVATNISEDKAITSQIINMYGIPAPKEPDYANWNARDNRKSLPGLIRAFAEQLDSKEVAVKFRKGQCGDKIIFLDISDPTGAARTIRKFMGANDLGIRSAFNGITMQERIFPPKITVIIDGKEEEFDWNLRSFTFKLPDGTFKVIPFVRYGTDIVNISKGANVMTLKSLIEKLNVSDGQRFSQDVRTISIDTFKAMEAYIADLREKTMRKEIDTNPLFTRSINYTEPKNVIVLKVENNFKDVSLVGARRWITKQEEVIVLGQKPVLNKSKFLEILKNEGNLEECYVFIEVHFLYQFYPIIEWVAVSYKNKLIRLVNGTNGDIYPLAFSGNWPCSTFKQFSLRKNTLKYINDKALEYVRMMYKSGDNYIPGLDKIFQNPTDLTNDGNFSIDMLGVDIISNKQLLHHLMEINDYAAGGMWDLNQITEPKRHSDTIEPIYTIAIEKGRKYKEKTQKSTKQAIQKVVLKSH